MKGLGACIKATAPRSAVIDGKEEFGPGCPVPDIIHQNDVVKSVVRKAYKPVKDCKLMI